MFASRRAGVKGITSVSQLVESGARRVEAVSNAGLEVRKKARAGIIGGRVGNTVHQSELLLRVECNESACLRVEPSEPFVHDLLRVKFLKLPHFVHPIEVNG